MKNKVALLVVVAIAMFSGSLFAAQVEVRTGYFKFNDANKYGYNGGLLLGAGFVSDYISDSKYQLTGKVDYYSDKQTAGQYKYEIDRTSFIFGLRYSFEREPVCIYAGAGIGLVMVNEDIYSNIFRMNTSWNGPGQIMYIGAEKDIGRQVVAFFEIEKSYFNADAHDLGGLSLSAGVRFLVPIEDEIKLDK